MQLWFIGGDSCHVSSTQNTDRRNSKYLGVGRGPAPASPSRRWSVVGPDSGSYRVDVDHPSFQLLDWRTSRLHPEDLKKGLGL